MDTTEQQPLQAGKLAAWTDGLKHRIAAQNQIINDLAARRLVLLEAAARLRELYRSAPARERRLFRQRIPAPSNAERFCRAVILLVEGYLPEGDETKALVAALKRELQGHLQSGSLRLPD
jgi:hypothetical protein